jgi:hypothetical protein
MLVKDEIRPVCNLPPGGNSTTRNAALRDILPFDEHIGFELAGMVAKIFHRRWTEMRYDLKGR